MPADLLSASMMVPDAAHEGVVAEAVVQTLPATSELGDENEEGALDTAEEKRLKRMRRNRESAAQSRNRKKQYVDSLESEIRQLKSTINNLPSENYELRREHARLIGAPPPIAPEAPAVLAPVDAPAECADIGEAAVLPPPIATHAISNEPPNAAHAAPSPRASDALIGLELLSRSASINGGTDGGDKGEDAGDGGAGGEAMTMDADAGKEVDGMAGDDGGGCGGAQSACRHTGTASGSSSASSMVMDTW